MSSFVCVGRGEGVCGIVARASRESCVSALSSNSWLDWRRAALENVTLSSFAYPVQSVSLLKNLLFKKVFETQEFFFKFSPPPETPESYALSREERLDLIGNAKGEL